MPPSKIMIIRHAEKPTDDPNADGVDANGTKDANSLIVQGWQRAGALGRLFRPLSGPPPRDGLAVPDFIFAAGVDDTFSSLRAQRTVDVVSALPPAIPVDSSYGPDAYKKAANAILKQDGVGLVAWEHHNIKHLVKHITKKKHLAPHWSGDRFDVVLVLDPEGSDGWSLTQVFQMLLPDDSETPLPPATAEDLASLDDEGADA